MANKTLALVGRLIFCLIFFGSAFNKVSTFDKSTGGPGVAFMAPKLDHFLGVVKAKTGITIPIDKDFYPNLLLTAAVCEAFGAFLFAMDIKFGAVALLIFMVPVTVIMHNFWDEAPNSQEQHMQMIHFLKNLSMIGAVIFYMGYSEGTTVEERRKKKEKLY
mmetsp:Transcript_1003/g.2171  ORF Transcript_1003/g.2171 Transcript_1003/m.2171 type:complete len:161 (-) Transcript_1003:2266-2748(-)